jgi:glyoxylase-like metal-dependent hydrolase (beta-lactamase superfamily II)
MVLAEHKMHIRKLVVGDLRANCYIVNIGDETLVVDPGEEAARIIEELENNHDLNLRYLLLTHGHFDHVMAVDDLSVKYPHLSVLIHEDDIKLLRETTEQGLFVGKLLHKVSAEVVAVSDGSSIPFGDLNIKTMHTPGHTKGSVCYQLGDYLFTGDTIFYHTYGRIDLPWSEPSEMKDSIDKILHLPENIKILPGHGRETAVKEERDFNNKGEGEYF